MVFSRKFSTLGQMEKVTLTAPPPPPPKKFANKVKKVLRYSEK